MMLRSFRRFRSSAVIAAVSLAGLFGPLDRPADAQSRSILSQIENSGEMTVCYADVTPDSYENPKTGQWTGVFVDLVDELAKWMHVKVRPVNVTWATAVSAIKQGECELFGASLLYNAPRAMQIEYIVPFSKKGSNAVILAANPKQFTKPLDFDKPGVKLAVIAGSRDQFVAEREFPKAKILAYQSPTDIGLFAAVRNGDADAAFANGLTIRWWLQNTDNKKWARIAFADDLSVQPNGWAIAYGHPKWKSFLDSFARYVAAEHQAEHLYASYLARKSLFTSPTTPTWRSEHAYLFSTK